MEWQVAERARMAIETGKPELLSYDLQYRKLGAVDLACGGAVDVLIEPLDVQGLPLFRSWLDAMERRRLVRTVTMLTAGGRLGLVEVRIDPQEPAPAANEGILIEDHLPRPHVLLIGGGHINLALAQLLERLEYFYSVMDPRPAFVSEERFPRAWMRCALAPAAGLAKLDISEFTGAVVCSHSQTLDYEAVKGLLERGFPGRIGVIGSRSKRNDFERRLRGVDLSRVEIPIGIDIGAEGVEEIAVSIAGSLIRCHRTGR